MLRFQICNLPLLTIWKLFCRVMRGLEKESVSLLPYYEFTDSWCCDPNFLLSTAFIRFFLISCVVVQYDTYMYLRVIYIILPLCSFFFVGVSHAANPNFQLKCQGAILSEMNDHLFMNCLLTE